MHSNQLVPTSEYHRYEFIVPVSGSLFFETQSIAFASGVQLVPTPEWVKDESVLSRVAESERHEIEYSRFSWRIQFEAESLEAPDPEWLDGSRLLRDKAYELIIWANLSVWLAQPAPLNFSTVILAEQASGGHVVLTIRGENHMQLHPKFTSDHLTLAHMMKAVAMHENLVALGPSVTVRMGARAMWAALTEHWWEGRYLLFWIAMEALFGPEQEPQEISHKLATRISHFLVGPRPPARKIYRAVKKGYRWRSKVVHGHRLSNLTNKMSYDLLYCSERLARECLQKVLASSSIVAVMNSNTREEFLDNGLFCATFA